MKLNLTKLLIGFCLVGCAVKSAKTELGTVKIEPAVSVFIEPEAKSLFLQAEKDLQNRNYVAATTKFQNIRNRWPRSKAAEVSHYRVASLFYSRGEYSKSVFEFDSFIKKYPLSPFAFDAHYNLAASEYQLNQYDKAQVTLNRLKKEEVRRQGNKRALTFYQLQALNATSQSDDKTAILAYSNQLALVSDEVGKSVLEEKIEKHLQKINDVNQLQDLVSNGPELICRNRAAKRLAALGLKEAPKESDDFAKYRQAEISIPPMDLGAGTKGSRNNIGVILPLKGRLAPYGKKALEGILLASKMFQTSTGEGFNVFVEDSGSSPAMAQAALDSLVQDKNVIAVIGPLNFKEGLAVAERAQSLGVVNISLASKAGVSSQGPYIFQNALTPKVQLENLVRFSVADRGLQRFAILSPSNAFGRDMTNEFWEQVESRGGKVVGVEFYDPTETDFQDSIKSLIGLKDVRFRRNEWTALQEYSKEMKAKTGREPKLKLKPIIDFDAIFLPDSPKTVAAIAAGLAYLDVRDLPLLGITEWNSDQLYKRGGQFVEKAVFPGVMNPVTRSSAQRDFMRSYQEAFGTQADLLAAQGFEAMELISVGLQKSQSSNRADLAKQINMIQNLEAPIGITGFDESRIAKRNIPLYMLDQFGNFVEQ
ncbi:MAG: penicillin-binding protein activator [Pseudomonadota bacterium]